jgi:hypothetical protein
MALSKTLMATMRIQELAAAYPGIQMSGAAYDEMVKYYEADSSGIIKEFLANAVVTPGTFANSAGNVAGAGKVT